MVGAGLCLESGQRVCDIGCGYGATAIALAQRHRVQVTGVTVSSVQAGRARENAAGVRLVEVFHQDWLANAFQDACFDRAYAIESSEHMVDKERFFREAFRTLRPGGRMAVCAWLARDGARPWEVRHLLQPICREGRLPSMGTEADYRRWRPGPAFASKASRTSASVSAAPGPSARDGWRRSSPPRPSTGLFCSTSARETGFSPSVSFVSSPPMRQARCAIA
jgi:SAM-dependent methyltransferase